MSAQLSKLIVESNKDHDSKHEELEKRAEIALKRSTIWLEKHLPANEFSQGAFSSN